MQHDHVLVSGEFTLRAVHTPGHVGNHYCYLLEEEGMLFAGDHIMNGSTVVIIPPSGDMTAYIESLRLLLRYPLRFIAPGHGDVMAEPGAVVDWLVRHRLMREQKVIAFCCNWCSYAGADLAGVSRIQYPSNGRIIRVMCSGMVHPNLVINALTKGADGVLVCG